jgi:hypothetical protein
MESSDIVCKESELLLLGINSVQYIIYLHRLQQSGIIIQSREIENKCNKTNNNNDNDDNTYLYVWESSEPGFTILFLDTVNQSEETRAS